MSNKLNKQIRELQQEIIDLKIEKHRKHYIHIPFNWKVTGRFFALMGSVGLAIFNFFIIISTWKLVNLGGLNESDIKGAYQLLIVYPIIGEYILIGLAFVCLTALIKGGFNKINKYDDGGLIFGLIGGLIVGLIFGLIGGLIFGLIGGLIGGLIVGLIFGLIGGLQEEFN